MNKASLGDYVAIKTGKLDANAADENGLYPFFTCAERVRRINTPAYDCECVLVAGNGDLNVKYYSGKFNAYQRTYIIETKDSENLTVPYLYRFLDYYVETLRNQSIGGVIKYIKLGNLTGALIPLVGIDEQHSTVSLLDGLDAVINKTRQQLIKYDTLIKSRFVEMFGDLEHGHKCSLRKLDSIAEVGSSKRVFKNELLAEGVPFYRGTEIAELSAGGAIKPSLFISKEHYERLIGSTGKPEIGDLLLPSICPDGQIWRVNTDTPFYFKDGRVLWIRPDRNAVDGVYLRHALSTMFQMSFSNIASGTTFAELKIFLLKKLSVPLPELKAQKEFVSFVSQVDKLRFATQQQIDKLETLKKSLMQEYFG